jgi:hypothetical protein
MTDNDPRKAIEDGGQALRSNRFPWYDRTNDSLHRLEVRAAEKPHFLPFNPALNFLIFWGALAVLAVVLAALVLMILRAVGLRKSPARNRGEPLLVGEARRIEALPYPVARANLSLLDQARNFYQAGNYAAAMIYLFSHQLVQLDRRQIIRLAKGKTNRQYLREVAGHPFAGHPLAGGGAAELLCRLVGQTLVAFEDVFFGHHDIDRRRFEACWSRLPEFESLLAQRPPS